MPNRHDRQDVGTAGPARSRDRYADLRHSGAGVSPGPVPRSPRHHRYCRCGSGTELLSTVAVSHHHRWRRCGTGTGDFRNASRRRRRFGGTGRPGRRRGGDHDAGVHSSTVRLRGALSTATSGSTSRIPKGPTTVRDNRRQPATTSTELLAGTSHDLNRPIGLPIENPSRTGRTRPRRPEAFGTVAEWAASRSPCRSRQPKLTKGIPK